MHRKRVMMQRRSRADRQPVKNEKLVATRPFGSAKGRLNQIAAATAWIRSSTSPSEQLFEPSDCKTCYLTIPPIVRACLVLPRTVITNAETHQVTA
jgi:hypothetical protein